jgi:hypothetical protein
MSGKGMPLFTRGKLEDIRAGNRVRTDDLLITNSQLPCSALLRPVPLRSHESAPELVWRAYWLTHNGTQQCRLEHEKWLQNGYNSIL